MPLFLWAEDNIYFLSAPAYFLTTKVDVEYIPITKAWEPWKVKCRKVRYKCCRALGLSVTHFGAIPWSSNIFDIFLLSEGFVVVAYSMRLGQLDVSRGTLYK